MPINNLEANIHYGDEWIYNGLPSIELFLSKKSPIKILSNLINKENNNSLLNNSHRLSLFLESIDNNDLSVPISKLVKIDDAFVQHWNISSAGFESSIAVLFETFLTTQIDKFDQFTIPILLESFEDPNISLICPRPIVMRPYRQQI